METFNIKILPRETITWKKFVQEYPANSIGLDGIVSGGPRYDPKTRHVNFDHHDKVNREATMCSALQVYMAIKGGLIKAFNGKTINIYINDTDQDTSLAVWLLLHYNYFNGVQSSPIINRLLDVTNKLDVTGGAYPLDLRNELVQQHNWIFSPYTHLRKSGKLATADKNILRDNLEAICGRLDKAYIGEAGQEKLDCRYKILYENQVYKVINEIGGNDARHLLFSHGLEAFISIVAHNKDGSLVVSIGRRSQYIPFPVDKLYKALNKAERIPRGQNGWGGSGIIGGSPRIGGTRLSWEQIRDITDKVIKNNKR